MAVQVIKANDDLTPEHHQFFLYQMLRGLKYIHTGPHILILPFKSPTLTLPSKTELKAHHFDLTDGGHLAPRL